MPLQHSHCSKTCVPATTAGRALAGAAGDGQERRVRAASTCPLVPHYHAASTCPAPHAPCAVRLTAPRPPPPAARAPQARQAAAAAVHPAARGRLRGCPASWPRVTTCWRACLRARRPRRRWAGRWGATALTGARVCMHAMCTCMHVCVCACLCATALTGVCARVCAMHAMRAYVRVRVGVPKVRPSFHKKWIAPRGSPRTLLHDRRPSLAGTHNAYQPLPTPHNTSQVQAAGGRRGPAVPQGPGQAAVASRGGQVRRSCSYAAICLPHHLHDRPARLPPCMADPCNRPASRNRPAPAPRVALPLSLGQRFSGAAISPATSSPAHACCPAHLVLCNLRASVSALAAAFFWCRDLINTPAEDLGPQDLVHEARQLAGQHAGASVRVIEVRCVCVCG